MVLSMIIIVLLSVASISSFTLVPLIFQCCKKKKGKKDKKQGKTPEGGGGGSPAKDGAKDVGSKEGGPKAMSAEAAAHKKPEGDKKKAPVKADPKNVKLPITYHVLKGKETSSELAKKTTATAQVVTSSPQQSTGPDAATKSKELAAKSGQKSDASKKPTGSKASLVKSNTNEDAQQSKSNTGVFEEANSTDNASQKPSNSGIHGVEVPATGITETSRREEDKPPGGVAEDTQLYETVPGGDAVEKQAAPQDEAGGSYESLGDLNIEGQK